MYWNKIIEGNTVAAWLITIGLIAGAFFVLRIIKSLLMRNLKVLAGKSKTAWDDFAVWALDRALLPILFSVAVYSILSILSLPRQITKAVYVFFLAIVTFFVLRVISGVFKRFVHTFIHKREDGDKKERQARGLIVIVNIIIWILGILFFVDNLGYNITTLIAGLGIGGVAIALAGQAILGDLFSYFVIFFDRPFEIGDFITVDDESGTIEFIGIKTTRVRTLSGEQLVFSNSDLTGSRLHNYKLLTERRVQFDLTILFHEDLNIVAAVPGWIKEIIESIKDTRFDRAHLSSFSESGLVYEFVYIVISADYNYYMDIQQSVLMKILERLYQHGLKLAYPSRNIVLNNAAAQAIAPDQGQSEKPS